MEIERKWMVNGWPEGENLPALPLKEEFAMRQGYISVRPTVRIREEALKGGETAYILCFKSGSGLAREEIERPLLEQLTGCHCSPLPRMPSTRSGWCPPVPG